MPKLVPVASTPLTVMFFDSIITQGVKQETISTTAAVRPIHFIYRIVLFAIAVQDTELNVLLQRIESEEYRAETREKKKSQLRIATGTI